MSLQVSLPSEADLLSPSANSAADVGRFLESTQRAQCQRQVIFFDESLTGYVIYKGDRAGDFSVYLDVSIFPGGMGQGPGDPGVHGVPSTSASRSPRPQPSTLQQAPSSPTRAQIGGYESQSASGAAANGNVFSVLNFTLTEDDIVYSGVSPPPSPAAAASPEAANDDDEASATPYYIIWTFNLPVVYPRKKFTSPKIRISCYLNEEVYKSAADSQESPRLDGHDLEVSTSLERSAVPLADFEYADKPNILEELNHSVVAPPGDSVQHKFQFIEEKKPAAAGRAANGSHSHSGSVSSINGATSSGTGRSRAASHLKEIRESQEDVTTVAKEAKRAAAAAALVQSQSQPSLPLHLNCSISLPITVSLVIKLKSTKPAGRNNLLLSTLNIEASDELQRLYTRDNNIFFNILNLSVVFKSGSIHPLNPASSEFPIRFKLEDSLNVTYKLINNDFIDKELKQQSSVASGGVGISSGGGGVGGGSITPSGSGAVVAESSYQYSSTKQVNIRLTLEVQKWTETAGFTTLSSTILTTWNPYLDFSIIAPPINSSLKTTMGPTLPAPPVPGSTIGGALSSLSQLQLGSPPIQQQAAFFQKQQTASTRKSALLNNQRQRAAVNGYQDSNANAASAGSGVDGSGSSGAAVGSDAAVVSMVSTPSEPATNLTKALNSASSVTVNLTTTSSALAGLKLTFIGKLSIPLGEITTWKLQAINNSSANLNLSLLVQSPGTAVGGPARGGHGSSTPFLTGNSGGFGESATSGGALSGVDSPIMNPNKLFSLYNSLKVAKSGVVILDNDIKLGPLETKSVFETEIKLIGVTRGVYTLDGIKIFDTNTGTGLDFGKLVEVFVV